MFELNQQKHQFWYLTGLQGKVKLRISTNINELHFDFDKTFENSTLDLSQELRENFLIILRIFKRILSIDRIA